MAAKKQNKVPVTEFNSEKVLERLKQDRARLVEVWGEAEFERRRKALEKYISNRSNRKVATPRSTGRDSEVIE